MLRMGFPAVLVLLSFAPGMGVPSAWSQETRVDTVRLGAGIEFDSAAYARLEAQRVLRANSISDAQIDRARTRAEAAVSRLTIRRWQSAPTFGAMVVADANIRVSDVELSPGEPQPSAAEIEREAAESMLEVITSEAKKVVAGVSLGDAFLKTARTMAIVEPEAAVSINRRLGFVENLLSGASTVATGLGAMAFLSDKRSDAGGWALVASLSTIVNQALGYLGDQAERKQANLQVPSALTAAREYASRFATNVYLTEQLALFGRTSEIIETDLDAIANTSTSGGSAQALETARAYVSAFEQLDQFYSTQLLGLATSLEERAAARSPVYTPASLAAMQTLAGELRQAHRFWVRARSEYEKSLTLAQQYIATQAAANG